MAGEQVNAVQTNAQVPQPFDDGMHRTARKAGTFVDDGEARRWIVPPGSDRPRIDIDVPIERMADRTHADRRWRTDRFGHHGGKPQADAADSDHACVRIET